MRSALIAIGLGVLNAGYALAQTQMGQTAAMTARPLMVEDLSPGTVTVRVGRGSLSNLAVGVEVVATLIAPDGNVSQRSEKTQADGRATFSNLPLGSQFRAQAIVDGQTLETASFAIPAEGGVRLMLVSSRKPDDEPAGEPSPSDSAPGERPTPHGSMDRQTDVVVAMLGGEVSPKEGLAPGTVEIRIVDAQGMPVVRQEVRLGRMSTTEQGVSWVNGTTDENGVVRFRRLEPDEVPSYVAVIEREGVRLGSPRFQVSKGSGAAGTLRIPGRTDDLSVLRLSDQSKILIDLREDKLEVMENLVVMNTSEKIFQPDRGGVVIPLPAEASGAAPLAGGSPLEAFPPAGFLLRQTIPPSVPELVPAQARLVFYYPTAGESSVTIRQPMPLGLEGAVIMIPATAHLTLNVTGLKALPPQEDDRGDQMVLFQVDPVPRNGVLTLTISGLPTRSTVGKTIAGVLAAALVLGTLFGLQRPPSVNKQARKRETLMAELVEVERARQKADPPDPRWEERRTTLLATLVTLDDDVVNHGHQPTNRNRS